MAPNASALLDRRRRVMMPCVGNLYGDHPLEPVRGAGTRLWDSCGREYLDFYAGVAVNSLGHCHPEVVEAATRQLSTLQHTTTLYPTETSVALCERLLDVAPEGLTRVFLCADGSGANEGAMIAARRATGRPAFVALDRGLHGRTSLTLAATGIDFWRSDPFPPNCVHFIPTPIDAATAEASLAALAHLLEGAEGAFLAGMIAEPVLGNGGIVVPPPEYFARAHAMLREAGSLLIVDEVQTGLCRTGRWFGIEHWGVRPDLLTVAKALGGGLPIGAWMATEEVARACSAPSASTFGGNLVPCAAALKVLEVMDRDNLAARAEEIGSVLLDGVRQLANEYDSLGVPRGLGMMIGIDVLRNGQPNADACTAILDDMRRQGVLVGRGGPDRATLVMLPPLIATASEVARVLETLGNAAFRLTGEAPC